MIVQLGKSDDHKLERIHAREIDYINLDEDFFGAKVLAI
jgi:hypothetical protein